MPVVVEILDPKTKKHARLVKHASTWLLGSLPRVASAKRGGNFYVEIYLVGDKFMNKNVLSFPHPEGFPRPDLKAKPLGEIYLNPKYIEEHAENLTYMLIHGFLHLLGYDHIKKNDRITMEKLEQRLLSKYELSRRPRHRVGKH